MTSKFLTEENIRALCPQYAEARCYSKKRWMGFDFKFKKFSIKQAFFINNIFSSRVKASTQKRFEGFFLVFAVFLLFLLVLALFQNLKFSKHLKKIKSAIYVFDAIFYDNLSFSRVSKKNYF